MMPSLRKSATLAQTDSWRKDRRLRLVHACIAHIVEMVNKFGSEDKYLLCADGQVYTCSYKYPFPRSRILVVCSYKYITHRRL
jgi:hypothetical protein